MHFSDSETQRLLRGTARSYLAGAYPWERLYRIERGGDRVSEEALRQLAELGWFGLPAPEAAGGAGASLLDAAAVIEELGYAAVPAPVAAANIAAYLLASAPAAVPVAELLAGLTAGERLCTVSEAVRRHGRAAGLASTNGKINGRLPLVPFADVSAFVVAPLAIDGEAAFAALPLQRAELEPVELMDRRCYAHAQFRGVDTNEALVLATGARAEELHEQCDALVTAFALIELAGMMQRVLELTSAHISTRVQFGQAIAKFQAARHRAAELLTQVETTRWAAYHALWRLQKDGATDEIWLAKHWAVRAADRVYQISHLLHGGVGVGLEHPLHLYTQGIAAFAVRGGTIGEMTARTIESLQLSGGSRASR